MEEAATLDPRESGSACGDAVYVIGLGNAVALRLAGYSMLLAFLAAGVFSALTAGGGPVRSSIGWLQPVLFIAVYFAAVVAHELVHGMFFRAFGGSPRYGAGSKYFMPYFYATSPGDAFSPRQMIIIGLAPLLVISILALTVAILVPALTGYLAVVFIGNTAGAVGDLWMTGRLFKFLSVSGATVVDMVDGMAVHGAGPRAEAIFAGFSTRDARPAGFVAHWMGAAVAVLVIEMLAGLVGPILTDNLLIGPAQLPLMAFTRSIHGVVWKFNAASPLLAGLVFALAARLFSHVTSPSTGVREV